MNDAREGITFLDLAEARYAVYRILAEVFLHPVPTRIAGLRELASERRAQSTLRRFPFYPDWRNLLDRLAALEESDSESLRSEFAAAFLGRGVQERKEPRESRFLAADNGAATQIEVDLVQRYGNVGMSVHPKGHVPTDHLSTQLEYLAVLIDREYQGWVREDVGTSMRALRLQRAFLRTHLDWWLPRLRHQIAAAAPGSIYDVASRSCEHFIHHERDLVNLLIELAAGAQPPAERNRK